MKQQLESESLKLGKNKDFFREMNYKRQEVYNLLLNSPLTLADAYIAKIKEINRTRLELYNLLEYYKSFDTQEKAGIYLTNKGLLSKGKYLTQIKPLLLKQVDKISLKDHTRNNEMLYLLKNEFHPYSSLDFKECETPECNNSTDTFKSRFCLGCKVERVKERRREGAKKRERKTNCTYTPRIDPRVGTYNPSEKIARELKINEDDIARIVIHNGFKNLNEFNGALKEAEYIGEVGALLKNSGIYILGYINLHKVKPNLKKAPSGYYAQKIQNYFRENYAS